MGNWFPDPGVTAKDIPSGDLAMLQTLRDQFEQSIGYNVTISDDMLAQLDKQNVTNLTQFGQQVAGNGWLGNIRYFFPWAQYGMSQNQYVTTLAQYQNAWESLTGQGVSQQNPIWFESPMANGLSASEASANWKNNASLQAAFPWLKFNMDYQQFTAQKQTMTQAFGKPLSDQEAAQQLTYFHSNQGADKAVSVNPTFTQVEKKQASVGVTGPGSSVR